MRPTWRTRLRNWWCRRVGHKKVWSKHARLHVCDRCGMTLDVKYIYPTIKITGMTATNTHPTPKGTP